MPLISFTVRMTFPQEDCAAIDGALLALTQASRHEPGCITYTAHRVQSTPDTVLIYEQYKDEAALDAHKESTHFQQYAEGVLYQKMTSREVEQLVALS